jgi:hypothetical protein
VDAANALEDVWIQTPDAGVYNLTVFGRRVPGNGLVAVAAEPRTSTTGATRIDSDRQGYALVCTGDAMDVLVPPSVSLRAIEDPPLGCAEDSPSFSFEETSCTTCVAWEWDFGDGSPRLTTAVPTSGPHAFGPVPGLYLVSVTGRDAAGVMARSTFAVEVFIGSKATPGKVGNTLRVFKVPASPPAFGAKGIWDDLPVPDATGYVLYEFTASQKADIALAAPPEPPINAWPDPLHGKEGHLWCPTDVGACGPPVKYLQVRAGNCLGEPGP